MGIMSKMRVLGLKNQEFGIDSNNVQVYLYVSKCNSIKEKPAEKQNTQSYCFRTLIKLVSCILPETMVLTPAEVQKKTSYKLRQTNLS